MSEECKRPGDLLEHLQGLTPEEQKEEIIKASKKFVDTLGEDAWMFLILMLAGCWSNDSTDLFKSFGEVSTDTIPKGEQEHG